ncbi:MAG: hypothetical protein KDA81_21555, partial [Planctomycetaceae bacterium]|nr:hypothetical protein [Planctomycetaceae bacterium]
MMRRQSLSLNSVRQEAIRKHLKRRRFLQSSIEGLGSVLMTAFGLSALSPISEVPAADENSSGAVPKKPERVVALPDGVQVLMPRDRVPLSFIIDDSTCLVNMGHFCTPQFGECYPERTEYQKPWQTWPREIPDAFVREFGEWCAEHGVKGKYSIVPNPACVGWLDRELPGWSRQDLQASLKLVRELMCPNWDIHPEMITHTRVIDLKTGRPFADINPSTMENSYPQSNQSADELAEYLAYALRILQNCGLPCEGVTTPGGFGNRVKPELSLAVQQAVRDVYRTEIPHFFKYVKAESTDNTEPSIEHLSGLGTDHINLTVNIPAGTGDWFGGWQGDLLSQPDRYCNADATSGRMVEMIRQHQPALMLCHWPGMYSNGSREGFRAFQRVVTSIAQRFSKVTQWMKLSEIARYWAAKELTEIQTSDTGFVLTAPFATPRFTMQISTAQITTATVPGTIRFNGQPLREVSERHLLNSGTVNRRNQSAVVCIDLPQGRSELVFEGKA